MQHNRQCSLKRRRRAADRWAQFDRLPPLARRWLAQAALPWSPRSVARVWRAAVQQGGPKAALDRLDALERGLLAREAAAVWGSGYPSA